MAAVPRRNSTGEGESEYIRDRESCCDLNSRSSCKGGETYFGTEEGMWTGGTGEAPRPESNNDEMLIAGRKGASPRSSIEAVGC